MKSCKDLNSVWDIIREEIYEKLHINKLEIVINHYGRLKCVWGAMLKDEFHIVQKILYTKKRCIVDNHYFAITSQIFKKEIVFVFPREAEENHLLYLRFIDLIEDYVLH